MLLHPPRARHGLKGLAGRRLGHMNGASRARIEAVNGAERIDGHIDILNRHADQSLLERSVDALGVLRREVPRGRDDDLVTLDLAVFLTVSL